ncbi:hypothetical protein F5Y16DRAFT_364718 [Xylariaceae sp. FL0255]|nr:hypothetical protein F5Y16DRAFT_364718 [Xylariaceae sp. FL0255]
MASSGATQREVAEDSGLPEVNYDDGLHTIPDTGNYPEYAGPPPGTDEHYKAAFDGGVEPKSPNEYYHPAQYTPLSTGAVPVGAAEGGAGSTSAAATEGGSGKRYPFGLKKKSFLIVLAVAALIVVAALAGGLGGGLASKNGSKSSGSTPGSSGGNGTTNGTTPLIDSQLAAINYTDSGGNTRYAVFYQSSGYLMLSYGQGDGSTTIWTQVNISQQFEGKTGDSAVSPLPGTPLAAAAAPWQGIPDQSFTASLFYIDETNLVRQLTSTADDLSTWTYGTQWQYASKYVADSGSKLGAVPYYCDGDCQNAICATYQASDLQIWVSCSSAWNILTKVVMAYPESPMATIQFSAANGQNITNVDELRLFYYSDTAIQDEFFNYNGDNTWSSDSATIMTDISASSSSTSPQVVATQSDSNSQILVVAQDGSSGDILQSWWNTTWNTNQRASFVNKDGSTTVDKPDFNISAMALDNNHRFYALASNGSLLIEYGWDSDNPFVFSWTSNVISS